MQITVVTPAPPRSRHGNRGTALRWAGIFRALGHRAKVCERFCSGRPDLLVALHARRSADSILRYSESYPQRPLVVALTGTDLYGDLPRQDRQALQSVELAGRLIVLHQPLPDALPPGVRGKVRVIYQSAAAPRDRPQPRADRFDVCVNGHLREVKDPFRTAEAIADLPESSRIEVFHLGAAMSDQMQAAARRCAAANRRYHWLGDVRRGTALQTMAASRLMVISSTMEGGPTVLTEALAMQLPVLSTEIAGVVGMLGSGYPGYFPVGDTRTLRQLLLRAERDEEFLADLHAGMRSKSWLAEPQRELEAWRALLDELGC